MVSRTWGVPTDGKPLTCLEIDDCFWMEATLVVLLEELIAGINQAAGAGFAIFKGTR